MTVVGSDPIPSLRNTAGDARSDFVPRLLSALVLAPLAIVVAYLGGWLFILFWAVAAVTVLVEWIRVAAHAGGAPWIAAGVIYAAVLGCAPIVLRENDAHGFAAIAFLFAVIWTTDILAYAVGRLVGGAKLWPAVSPGKTWSGAIGGAAGAVVVGLVAAAALQTARPAVLAVLALVLSAAGQAGDLLESAFKRHFGVKDASHLIPGHGGVMDRLDSFLAAALVAVVIGMWRGGVEHAARGLLVW